MVKKHDPYHQAGVNISLGDKFSSIAAKVCKKTVGNSPYVSVINYSDGFFRGPRSFEFHGLPSGCTFDLSPDGIGTKVEIIDAAGAYESASQNWAAMTCGDITRWGGLPLVITNILDVKTLGKNEQSPSFEAYKKMAKGMESVAKDEGIVLFKGETAEMNDCVSSSNSDSVTAFSWGAAALGVYHPDKMILGNELRSGQTVMALKENGFRSNGFSMVRESFKTRYGDKWYCQPEAQDDLNAAAVPSVLYDKFLTTVNGWYEPDFKPLIRVYSVSHITGGGIEGKFARDILFPKGLSAVLDNLWEPPSIMKKCAEWQNISDKDFYRIFNGGQGVLAVIDKKDVDFFIEKASEFRIEARPCGKIVQSDIPHCTILSKFSGNKFEYPGY